MILQATPARRIARFRREVDAAVAAVLDSETYIQGAAVASFEQAFAAYAQVSHCVGVASGTDALALALRALDIGPGDEVITTALTFAGTAQAILHCGARPRFVDVDPATRCIDPVAVATVVNRRTAVVLPVHLFGHPCDMPALMALAGRHGLAVALQAPRVSAELRARSGPGVAPGYFEVPDRLHRCTGHLSDCSEGPDHRTNSCGADKRNRDT